MSELNKKDEDEEEIIILTVLLRNASQRYRVPLSPILLEQRLSLVSVCNGINEISKSKI